MNKVLVQRVLIAVALFAGVVVVAKRFESKMQGIDWEKRFERMPDTAPPKWMFSNISAIRENTDRILEALGREPLDTPAPDSAAT